MNALIEDKKSKDALPSSDCRTLMGMCCTSTHWIAYFKFSISRYPSHRSDLLASSNRHLRFWHRREQLPADCLVRRFRSAMGNFMQRTMETRGYWRRVQGTVLCIYVCACPCTVHNGQHVCALVNHRYCARLIAFSRLCMQNSIPLSSLGLPRCSHCRRFDLLLAVWWGRIVASRSRKSY